MPFTFGFGQQAGQIIQFAYVVPDIQAAIDHHVKDLRVGPWFLLDSFNVPGSRYRGEPSHADIRLAMAFSGHMMIELIAPKDDEPSVYRDTIQRRGYGFHHFGVAVEGVEAARAEYLSRGYVEAFSTPVPSGGNVYYLEPPAGSAAAGFIELIPAAAGTDALFTKYWQASVGWDGSHPIRAFG